MSLLPRGYFLLLTPHQRQHEPHLFLGDLARVGCACGAAETFRGHNGDDGNDGGHGGDDCCTDQKKLVIFAL